MSVPRNIEAEEQNNPGIVADVIADVSALSGVSDVPRQLFRRRRSGADEGDAGKNVGNYIGDYRIMGASEDQGVDLSVTEGMKVMLAGQPGDSQPRPTNPLSTRGTKSGQSCENVTISGS